jgi:pyridoxine 5-phosphate synthase
VLSVPLNLEMANAPEIVEIALDVKPDEVCMVPEKRRELTTEGGLDVVSAAADLGPSISALREAGVKVSLFIDPTPEQVLKSVAIGAPCIELHTGTFCEASDAGQRDDAEAELTRLIEAARLANEQGLQVNAGHGINIGNLGEIMRIPFLDTLNIGHSIVAQAVFLGLEGAVREMLDSMADYTGGEA